MIVTLSAPTTCARHAVRRRRSPRPSPLPARHLIEMIRADSAVLAFGMRPDTELGDALAARGLDVRTIGDAAAPGKAGDAIHAGYLAALDL